MNSAPCSCDGPGFCERFRRNMVGRLYELCSGKCPPERPCSEDLSNRYRLSWDEDARDIPPEEPSLLKKARNLTKAVAGHVRDGMRHVSQKTLARRQLVCEHCPSGFYVKKGDQGRCLHPDCGCYLSVKIQWADQECPVRHWGPEEEEEKEEENEPLAHKTQPTKRKLKWAYGVTTVPQRMQELLPSTLVSLANAGFDNPRLFVDGGGSAQAYARFSLPLTMRESTIRTFGNWVLALYELYLREPKVDRYAIFQDDLVMCRGAREYIDSCEYPEKGYWNLYTHQHNHALCKGDIGWFLSNQMGRGALALVFNREAVTTLLSSEHMVLRPLDAHRGHRSVDGGIVTGMKKAGWKEYTHNPSLVQHTGIISSMGNRRHPLSPSFPGESFDALSLLEKPCTTAQ